MTYVEELRAELAALRIRLAESEQTREQLAVLRKAFADQLTERNEIAAGVAALHVALGVPPRDFASNTLTNAILDAVIRAREIVVERDRLRWLLGEATRLGARMAGLECDSGAEERFAAIRREVGL